MAESEAWVKVYESFYLSEVQVLVGALTASGLRARILGDNLASLMGDIPATIPLVSVEVLESEKEEAEQIIARRARSSGPDAGPPAPAWNCDSCGERNPGGFELCWACGTPVAV